MRYPLGKAGISVALSVASGMALAQAPDTPESAQPDAAESAASAPAAVDTSGWRCKFCEFETGVDATVSVAGGQISRDSARFGEYTGYDEEGVFALVGASARWRGEEAGYLDLSVTDFSLDPGPFAPRTTVDIEGGVQGSYGLRLRYDEIPHLLSDSARTPYVGSGGADLDLPAGWVTAGSTAGMSGLASSLRGVDLDTERRRAEIGVRLIATRHWDFGVDVRRETTEGRRRTAGAFLFNAAQLVQPIDYETREVEAFAGYSHERWQLRLAYLGSAFENADPALSWENPFTPLVAGADEGELALPPDNEFHQLRVSAGYELSKATRLSGDLAVGRMEQNADFLAPTTNDGLGVAALPRDSLDGRVDTLNAALRVSSRLSDALRVNAEWRRNERDNQTARASFPWVSTDTLVRDARTNLPYDYTEDALGASAIYRLAGGTRVSAGVDRETVQRSFQEVEETREHSVWGKLAARATRSTSFDVRIARERRDGSGYDPLSSTDPPQNPSLRKYNLADRDRELMAVRTSTLLGDGVDLGVGASVARDDYSNSTVGLTRAGETGLDADLAVQLAPDTSLHAFVVRTQTDSRQAGSSSFAGPDWLASTSDTVDTAGFGVERRDLMGKRLDVGVDYAVSNARSAITVGGAPFPDLESVLHTVKLYATYTFDEGPELHGAWWYERYESKDWALDAVEPDTLATVLSLGEEPPSYSLHAVLATFRYRF